MLVCPDKLNKLINEVDEFDQVDRAVEYVEERAELERLVREAKKKGRYTNPKKKISSYIDKTKGLVGKKITLISNDDNTFKEVRVTKAEMIGQDLVSVNNGEIKVDMKTGNTVDGMYQVEVPGKMGSETTSGVNGVELSQLSGSVLEKLDEMVAKAMALDPNMTEKHKNQLMQVFDKYRQVLEEAGADVTIDVEFIKDLDGVRNTRGEADPEIGKMTLILSDSSENNLTEVLAHELQHVLIRNVLASNKLLESKVNEMRRAMANDLDWKIFLNNKNQYTEAEMNKAKERFEYVFHNSKFPADEFLAYATTNKKMMDALESVVDTQEIKWMNNIKEEVKDRVTGETKRPKWRKLWNKLIDAINKMYSKGILKTNGREMALDMLNSVLDAGYTEKARKQESRYWKIVDKINKADDSIAEHTGAIKKEHKNFGEYIRAKEKSKIKNAVKSIWKIRGLAKARSWALKNNIFNSMSKDMDNKDVAKFYEMFRHAKAFVEREVVAVKDTTANTLDTVYGFGDNPKTGMNKTLRQAAKRVLVDTDAKVLGSAKDILKYLKNETLIDAKLDTLTAELNEDTVLAINDLAELLVHNKSKGVNGYVNATQIAMVTETGADKDVVEKIDKAVSLQALKLSSELDKKLTMDMLELEFEYKGKPGKILESMDYVFEMQRVNQKEVLDKAYGGDEMYEVKGAKQEHFDSKLKHFVVEEKEMKELVKAKMVNLGKHEALSEALGKDVYLVAGKSVDVGYTEGLMSKVQLKNEGDSVRNLLMELGGMTEEEANDRIETMSKFKGEQDQALIPERSGHGGIYDYRVRIPHQDKVNYLGLDDDLIQTISGTVANLTHKQEAMLNNKATIRFLDKFYKAYKTSDEYKFVEISEKSTGKEKEYWDSLPFYVKRDINMMGGKLHVEESMLVDLFGYKDVSLTQLPWVKDKVRRQQVVKQFEDTVMALAKRWKKVIVAFTPATIRGNMLSNMVVATQHTKEDPITYIKKFKQIWGLMNQYQADRKQLLEYRIREQAGEGNFEKEIKRLETELKNNPVHIIMEDGQYTAILEDINTEYFDNEGAMEAKIKEWLGKVAKSPRKQQNVMEFFDMMYIRKNSTAHDSIMKLTSYSDAVNKMIILMDMIEKNGGVVTQDMLNDVDGLHVNYNYLDNRYIKYANDMGMLTFTKYMFRVFPAMIRMAGRKGLTMFLTEGAQKASGLDIENPLDPFYEPVESLQMKVSLWGDPINVFKDVLVSPWVK